MVQVLGTPRKRLRLDLRRQQPYRIQLVDSRFGKVLKALQWSTELCPTCGGTYI